MELQEFKPDREGEPGWYGKAFYFKQNDVLSLFENIIKLTAWRNEILIRNLHLKIDLDTEAFILRPKAITESLAEVLEVNEEVGTIAIKFKLDVDE